MSSYARQAPSPPRALLFHPPRHQVPLALAAQILNDPGRNGRSVCDKDFKLYVRSGPARGKDFKVDVKELSGGRFMLRWATHVSGVYQLAINCHSVAVEGSPLEVSVEMPVTTAANCTVRGVKDCQAGFKASFSIVAKDQAGNQRTRGGDDFNATIRGPGRLSYATQRDEGNGTYIVNYRATTAGRYKAIVHLKSKGAKKNPLPGSPFEFSVLPGPCAASQIQLLAGDPSGLPPRPGQFDAVGTSDLVHTEAVAGEEAHFWLTGSDTFGNNLVKGGDT